MGASEPAVMGSAPASYSPHSAPAFPPPLRPGPRHPQPLAGGTLDAVVLVVLAQEVAGDAEQPRRAGPIRQVLEAPRGVPGLRERLRRQVEGGDVRARLALEPGPHPGGVAVIELAEGEWVPAGLGEELGIGSGHVVRCNSEWFAT